MPSKNSELRSAFFVGVSGLGLKKGSHRVEAYIGFGFRGLELRAGHEEERERERDSQGSSQKQTSTTEEERKEAGILFAAFLAYVFWHTSPKGALSAHVGCTCKLPRRFRKTRGPVARP